MYFCKMLLIRTKLFETILAMTITERDRMTAFIVSPIFSSSNEETLLDLYTLLRNEVEKHERGETSMATEEELYKLLFPNKEWKQKTFDTLESRLLNVIKKAIIYQYASIDKFKSELTLEEEHNIEIRQLIYLAQFYRERKLLHQFESTINRLKTLQNTYPPIDGYFHIQLLIAQEEYDNASLYRQPERIDKRLETLESLDLNYIVQKLTILLQLEPPLKEKIEQKLATLENIIDSPNPIFHRIINLYRKAFMLIWHKEGEDEAILQEYLEFLEVDSLLLPIAQRKDLYTTARNFCVAKYKTGKSIYLNILFELIKKNLKAGFFYHKDGASEGIMFGAFQNIVAIALKLQESEWALNFLKEHRTKIIAPNAAEQERFYHFNLACYHFQRKEYDEALSLLKIDFDDNRYHLMARALEIKLYFEKPDKKDKEIDFLESRIAAFETYLSRNEMPTLDKTGYRNFLKLTKKLIKQKRINDKDLEDKDSIAEREWLLEKSHIVNEMIKKIRHSTV